MSNYPFIIGHRGASALAPENTLAAFSRAFRDGADGIEFDVRLARDNVPVVLHDASLKRTAGMKKLVSECTSVELQQIDVGAWFPTGPDLKRPLAKREAVPTLQEVFELFRDESGLLYLEMKGEPVGERLTAEVAKLIRNYSFAQRTVVESFDLAAVASLKQIAPEIRTAALFEPGTRQRLRLRRPPNIVALTRDVLADELALHHTLARPGLVAQAREAGLEVVVWTVDQKRWIARSQRLGIKALITNNPAALLTHRDSSISK